MGGLVWLASYPKSGNTWTRNFLHNLLAIQDDAAEVVPTTDINAMQAKTTWDSAYAWYKPFLEGKDFKHCQRAEVASVRMKSQEYMAELAREDLLFVKTHNAMMADHGGIPLINPKVTAGAVYIIRNPLDVAISYSHHLNRSVDKTIQLMSKGGAAIPGSDRMAYELHGSWSEHVHSWTRKPSSSLHIMRYEDMLDSPLEEFSRLADFLQIRASRERLVKAVEAAAFDKLRAQEQQSGFNEKPANARIFFRQGQSGEWRKVLNADQVQAIVATHGEQMQRFGYLP